MVWVGRRRAATEGHGWVAAASYPRAWQREQLWPYHAMELVVWCQEKERKNYASSKKLLTSIEFDVTRWMNFALWTRQKPTLGALSEDDVHHWQCPAQICTSILPFRTFCANPAFWRNVACVLRWFSYNDRNLACPTVFPNTCSLTSPMMSFATWLSSDFVLTLFAMRQLLGITGLP